MLTPAVVTAMAQRYRAGATVYDLAQQYGCHRTTVARHLKALGLILRADPKDPAVCARVRRVYSRVGSFKGTARELRISRDTVRKIIRMKE